MENKYKLKTWTWSSFGCDTAFFYFEQPNTLLMVEYWADENDVAPYAQHCEIDGTLIEDDFIELTEEEKAYFINVCQNKCDKN